MITNVLPPFFMVHSVYKPVLTKQTLAGHKIQHIATHTQPADQFVK